MINMTRELYLQCVIACLIGNILHVFVKILSLRKDHKIANLEFSFLGYLKNDWLALLFDVIASFVIVYLVDEWLSFNEFIIGKIKTMFVFIGYTGSHVILQLMSVAKKKFRLAVDYKTNISDRETGTLDKPTPTNGN